MRNRFTYPEILYGWLEITRPPNLFTIPGDILTGASLALIGKGEVHLIIPAVIISLFLYTSGLILNDYFDARPYSSMIFLSREVKMVEMPDFTG